MTAFLFTKKEAIMKDFNEVVLTMTTKRFLTQVYKKALETENKPNGLETGWNGVYAHAEIIEDDNSEDVDIMISLISHTLPNLKQVAEWYERVGCKLIYQNYREESK